MLSQSIFIENDPRNRCYLYFHEVKIINTSLAATMVRWCEGGVNLGLLPMTISEEESNLFCASHLLNCDEGQGQ
jgi:hypothetical protein